MPVLATNVMNLSVYSPVTIGSAPTLPSPPKFVIVPDGANTLS